jgi:hypothetical protein
MKKNKLCSKISKQIIYLSELPNEGIDFWTSCSILGGSGISDLSEDVLDGWIWITENVVNELVLRFLFWRSIDGGLILHLGLK